MCIINVIIKNYYIYKIFRKWLIFIYNIISCYRERTIFSHRILCSLISLVLIIIIYIHLYALLVWLKKHNIIVDHFYNIILLLPYIFLFSIFLYFLKYLSSIYLSIYLFIYLPYIYLSIYLLSIYIIFFILMTAHLSMIVMDTYIWMIDLKMIYEWFYLEVKICLIIVNTDYILKKIYIV